MGSIKAKMFRASGSYGGRTRSMRASFNLGVSARSLGRLLGADIRPCCWGMRAWRAEVRCTGGSTRARYRCTAIRPTQKIARQTSTTHFFLCVITACVPLYMKSLLVLPLARIVSPLPGTAGSHRPHLRTPTLGEEVSCELQPEGETFRPPGVRQHELLDHQRIL
jgi:hypothetical protein